MAVAGPLCPQTGPLFCLALGRQQLAVGVSGVRAVHHARTCRLSAVLVTTASSITCRRAGRTAARLSELTSAMTLNRVTS